MCLPSHCAKTRNRSATWPKLIHFFWPSRTYPVPLAVAVVATLLASLPTPGSVRTKAATVRPAVISGSQNEG